MNQLQLCLVFSFEMLSIVLPCQCVHLKKWPIHVLSGHIWSTKIQLVMVENLHCQPPFFIWLFTCTLNKFLQWKFVSTFQVAVLNKYHFYGSYPFFFLENSTNCVIINHITKKTERGNPILFFTFFIKDILTILKVQYKVNINICATILSPVLLTNTVWYTMVKWNDTYFFTIN